MSNSTNPKEIKSLPELAAAFYELVTSRNNELTCNFNNLEIDTPGSSSASGRWRINGEVRVRTTSTDAKQRSSGNQ